MRASSPSKRSREALRHSRALELLQEYEVLKDNAVTERQWVESQTGVGRWLVLDRLPEDDSDLTTDHAHWAETYDSPVEVSRHIADNIRSGWGLKHLFDLDRKHYWEPLEVVVTLTATWDGMWEEAQ